MVVQAMALGFVPKQLFRKTPGGIRLSTACLSVHVFSNMM